MSAWAPVRGVRAAVIFLTRLPVGGGELTDCDWRWANAHFPLIGAAVGGFAAGAWLLTIPLGPWLAAIGAVVATVALTGAFHEDGLADSADALGGAIDDRERVLAILKDSRLGTYGVVTLTLALLLRIALVARLDTLAPVSLVLAHCLARVPPVALGVLLPYVSSSEHSRSRDLLRAGLPQLVVAVLWGAAALVVLPVDPFKAAWVVAALVLAAALLGWRYRARVGGVTGDFLGATEQVGEILVLAVLAWP